MRDAEAEGERADARTITAHADLVKVAPAALDLLREVDLAPN